MRWFSVVGKLRGQTRPEAGDAGMKNSEQQGWAVNPTNNTALPLISPVSRRGC